THRRDRFPVENEASRRRFEGDRRAGNGCPCVPKREGHAKMSILNGMTVMGYGGPECIGRDVEPDQGKTGVPDKTLDCCVKRPKDQFVSRSQKWRCRPIFSANVIVARAEDNYREVADVFGGERVASGETNLDRPGCGKVYPKQACR